MKTIKALPVALIALLAFVVLPAAGASAHEWLIQNQKLEGPVSITGEQSLTLELLFTGLKIGCGTKTTGRVGVGNDASGEIERIAGEAFPGPIPCHVENGGTSKATSVEIEPLGLPWKTSLVEGKYGAVNLEVSSKTLGWEIIENSPIKKSFVCKRGAEPMIGKGLQTYGHFVGEVYETHVGARYENEGLSCNSEVLIVEGSEFFTHRFGGYLSVT
ncbi:MAG TPA: hypothetical protein VK756_00625 [Solirubrobacteraceae bacterium]|jgi:hypothetical protein|nr:hypothetical protein [Solirubrobacteraceae bacterium]